MARPKKIIVETEPEVVVPVEPEASPSPVEQFDPGLPESKQRHLR